jgi:hypothetical protein
MSTTNFDRLIDARLSLARVRLTAANRGALAAAAVEKMGVSETLKVMTDEEILGLLRARKTKAKTVGMISFRPTDGEVDLIAKLVLMFDGLPDSEVIRIAIHEAATNTLRPAILPQIPRQEQVDKIVQSMNGFIKLFDDAKNGFLAVDIPGDQTERAALVARARKLANAVLDQIGHQLEAARIFLALINGLKGMDSNAISRLGTFARKLHKGRDIARQRNQGKDDPDGLAQEHDEAVSLLLGLLYKAGLLGTIDPDEPNDAGELQ